ncbi:high-affinity branched-chain amino acid ABC transporter permease LivM [Azospirillum rugosum]|uniref:Branched-chain amino acid transport system permease protein n=1 Tax=Azospirillum rugosum TaxID=416170 RepID=A0ABS4SW08_9PROT|nr:high-affinity branched-chain amino acid ABC transporter permease LivM [Azospirillum rugosum]MBP2296741.1 branched-chain amino acid transport system permease protein [Azospirillum rugosum]MDQ0530446.1 branched-chain amino acid transport system permease protein [Azospirillum rugosum]
MTALSVSSPRSIAWPAILKEAAITAFVALLLTVPLVGLRTVDRPTGLGLETRWAEVAAAVGLVFLGRLGLCLIRDGQPTVVLVLAAAATAAGFLIQMPTEALRVILIAGGAIIAIRAAIAIRTGRSKLSQAERDQRMDRIAAKVQHASRWLGPIAVVVALAFPMTPLADRQLLDIGILLLTYIMLGWGLNIVVGLAGLLDLGYVAFYAVGAYSYALLAHYFGLSFWVCLPLAGLLAAGSGVLLGFPVLRLRGDYFAIVTLGFGEIIRIILVNWYQFTGGPNGISGIPRPSFFGVADFVRSPPEGTLAFHEMFGLEFSPLHRIVFLYYLILVLALVVNVFTLRIRKLPLGRAWEALREDDIACASLGINRTNMKLAAFAIAAMFGGFAGSFFATRQGFISPESFTFIESAIILAIVVLGGMGSQIGVVVATLLVIGLPEAFRELADYRMLAFGMGMVLIMLWRPRGLLAHRDPTILLYGRNGKGAGGAAAGTAAAGGQGIAGGRAK